MTQPVGGRRARLIKNSVYTLIQEGMDELGWFDTGRQHKPVKLIPERKEWNDEILPNLVTVTEEDIDEHSMELGSNLTEFWWEMMVDVYAENSAVGLDLATDIRDLLSGRFTTVSSVGPNIDVYDLANLGATPVPLFTVEIENVSMGRVRRDAPKPYQKYWWVVFFRVVDAYADEEY